MHTIVVRLRLCGWASLRSLNSSNGAGRIGHLEPASEEQRVEAEER